MNRTGDIMNLYKRSSKSADSLNISRTTDKGQASGGAMSSVSSPTPGDEFPFHLSSSTQINGMDGNVFTSKKKVNETTDIKHNQGLDAHIERNSLDLQNNSNCEPFKAGVPKMEEVLNEMCTLEEQDKSQPSIPDQDHPLLQSTLQEPVCSMTESFEADKYFEAEEQLKMMAEEHFHQSDKSSVDNSTVHLEDEDSLTDTTEHAVYKEVNITDETIIVKPDDSFNTSTASINQLENNSQLEMTGVLCSSAEIKVVYSGESKKAALQEQNESVYFQKGEIASEVVKEETNVPMDTKFESIAHQLVNKLHEFQKELTDANSDKYTDSCSETSFDEMSRQNKNADAPTNLYMEEDLNKDEIVENGMLDSIQDPEISSGNIQFIQASIVKEENKPTITAIVTNDINYLYTASNISSEKAAIMNSELQTADVKTEFTDATTSSIKTEKAILMKTEHRNLDVKTKFSDASTSPINWSPRIEGRNPGLSPAPQIEYRCIGTQCSFNDIGVHTLVQLARKSLKKTNKVVNK